MKPYKVCPYEPGAASVVDRATNEGVGYVLADYWNNWEAFLVSNRGVPIGYFKRRSSAVEAVWSAVDDPGGVE